MPEQSDLYRWRAAREADLDALVALDAVCQQADGEVSVPAPTYRRLLAMPDVQMLCALALDDQAADSIVGVGWLQPGESHVQLYGKVHPLHRRAGLGAYLL